MFQTGGRSSNIYFDDKLAAEWMSIRRADVNIETEIASISNADKSLFFLLVGGDCKIEDLVLRDDFFNYFVGTTYFQHRETKLKVLDWFSTVENISEFLIKNKQLDRKVDYYLSGLNLEEKPFHDRSGPEYCAIVQAVRDRNPHDDFDSIRFKADKFRDTIISKLTVIKIRTNKIATKLLSQVLLFLQLDNEHIPELELTNDSDLQFTVDLKWFSIISLTYITTIYDWYSLNTIDRVTAREPVRSLAKAREFLQSAESLSILSSVLSSNVMKSFRKFIEISRGLIIHCPVRRDQYCSNDISTTLSSAEQHKPTKNNENAIGLHLFLHCMSVKSQFGDLVNCKRPRRVVPKGLADIDSVSLKLNEIDNVDDDDIYNMHFGQQSNKAYRQALWSLRSFADVDDLYELNVNQKLTKEELDRIGSGTVIVLTPVTVLKKLKQMSLAEVIF